MSLATIIKEYRRLREGTAFEKQIAKWNINATYGKIGIDKMGYDCLREQMRDLNRCGCDRCREQAYRLEREYHHNRNYYAYPITQVQKALIGVDMAKETTVVEEPKNYAVKLLVDQLKQQQNYLTTEKNKIDGQKIAIKNANEFIKGYNKTKVGIENKIKELSGALKKLGHKE